MKSSNPQSAYPFARPQPAKYLKYILLVLNSHTSSNKKYVTHSQGNLILPHPTSAISSSIIHNFDGRNKIHNLVALSLKSTSFGSRQRRTNPITSRKKIEPGRTPEKTIDTNSTTLEQTVPPSLVQHNPQPTASHLPLFQTIRTVHPQSRSKLVSSFTHGVLRFDRSTVCFLSFLFFLSSFFSVPPPPLALCFSLRTPRNAISSHNQ